MDQWNEANEIKQNRIDISSSRYGPPIPTINVKLCCQLIQRLHNLDKGDMRLENANIDAVNVPWLRNKLGLVSQEPVLFNRTIADNIRYGDLAGTATMDQVMEAARRANLHTWVASLPAGYDTLVGSGGRQLSVGQRQRLAIAQTLVRWDTGHRAGNTIDLTTVPRAPRIMLLDEATSTLDFENEKAVQVGEA